MNDPGKGKSYALNIAFSKINADILILTDGDVYISKNAIEEIVNTFKDEKIGCLSGRPVPQESRDNKFGYWAHFLFDSANKIRKRAFLNRDFIECTGYLFAYRKKIIDKIPLDVSEDAVIPYIFKEKGYDIGYAEKAEVYVKNPDNLNDWIKQKTRTHKAHEKLHLYVDTKNIPRVKSFKTESKGIFSLLKYPNNFKEIIWAIELIFARLYTWIKYFFETKIFNKKYSDAWERVESTK
jgi:cellulose synthase/poly-beta-1,6-N-acetylglucosamine synthase-like glycosyltransferase